MIFFYENETARVVIHTANLIEQDWGKKTQGGWISSLLHKKDKKRPSGPNTTFESDLIRYLSAYADTSAVISDLKLYDFSHEKGVLVGSVPGSHECSERVNWGHMRLGEVLAKRVLLSESLLKSSELVFQFSAVSGLTEK